MRAMEVRHSKVQQAGRCRSTISNLPVAGRLSAICSVPRSLALSFFSHPLFPPLLYPFPLVLISYFLTLTRTRTLALILPDLHKRWNRAGTNSGTIPPPASPSRPTAPHHYETIQTKVRRGRQRQFEPAAILVLPHPKPDGILQRIGPRVRAALPPQPLCLHHHHELYELCGHWAPRGAF